LRHWLADLMERGTQFLFGSAAVRGQGARGFGVTLLNRLLEDDNALRELSDVELVSLVEYLLTNRSLRRPLQGNVRFLQSVTVQFRRKGSMSLKQRGGVLNILERAYPHNLAHELRASLKDER